MDAGHRESFLLQIFETDLQVLQFLYPHDGVGEVLRKILFGCMQRDTCRIYKFIIKSGQGKKGDCKNLFKESLYRGIR